MFKLTFLRADVPLTKTIHADGSKTSYPNRKNFTSIEVKVNSLSEFSKVLVDMANGAAKPCLLKGNLKHALDNEPRKGQMAPNTPTHWVCFDLDDAPFSTPEEFMHAIGLGDVSYILQYSASQGLTKSKALRCHLFAMLSAPVSPQNLRAWLMHLNLDIPVLERAITLSNQRTALHWPLDITTCQNDKLIYIATPIFNGIKDPLPKERIKYVVRPSLSIDIRKLELHPIETLKKKQNKKRDELRAALGLDPVRHKIKIVEDYEIQPNADEASYDIVERNEEFTRINLNGGDSAAYWFYNHDFELIRNFKGEPFVYMKDVLPDLYKALKRDQRSTSHTPSTNGDRVLAFRDKITGQYWKGLWNEAAEYLDIHSVDSKDKLHDFLQGHGIVPPPYVEEWQLQFNPHSTVVVDETNHIVNRFVPTPLMRPVTKPMTAKYPTIQKFLDHAIGTGEIQEHFLNWLAVIVQHRIKTKTAWILHGTEGTGKGILINKVLRTILGDYVACISSDDLDGQFNQWLEKTLLVFIDEIEADAFERKATEGKLRRMITDSPQPIRRMRTDTYDAPNYSNFIFASNKPQPVRIPLRDRRYNVGRYQSQRLVSNNHEIEIVIPSEIPAFAHYLMTRKACIDTAAQILNTEDRAAVQALSITSIDELADNILNGKLDKLMEFLPDESLMHTNGIGTPQAQAYWQLMKDIVIKVETSPKTSLSRDQLAVIFQHCIGKIPEGAHKFTSYLRHHNIVTIRIKENGIKFYGIHVVWKFSDTDLRDFRKLFQTKLPMRLVK